MALSYQGNTQVKTDFAAPETQLKSNKCNSQHRDLLKLMINEADVQNLHSCRSSTSYQPDPSYQSTDTSQAAKKSGIYPDGFPSLKSQAIKLTYRNLLRI